MGIKSIRLDTKVAGVRECKLPHSSADHVMPEGKCPECGQEEWKVQGGETTRGHDTYSAPARCVLCGERVGTLVVKMDTLFGLEEDERVLHGRARVY